MRLKNGSKIALIFICLILFYLLVLHLGILHLYLLRIEYAFADTSTNTLKDKCVILLWTTFSGRNWLYKLVKSNELECVPSNCMVTTDRSLFTLSRAVIFHLRDINPFDLPSQHLDGQFWVLVNHKAPSNKRSDTYQFNAIERHINWTLSYRLDSDMYVPHGRIVDRKVGEVWVQNVSFERKSKMIAWFVSNCNVRSGRLDYVHELQKYIPVDIFGWCGEFYCPKKDSDRCQNILQQDYKFYLAFENVFCKDYVTEKLFKALQIDIIPVVRGGANYSHFMPFNSYIDAQNFSSPKELAAFLKQVGNDKATYNSYFDWKIKKKTITSVHRKFICYIVNKLLSTPPNVKSIKNNLFKWWFEDAHCKGKSFTNWQAYFMLLSCILIYIIN